MALSRDFLGEFEQIVLLALIRLGDKAYGVPVRQEIENRTNRAVSVGALYSTLDRLEAKGFITSRFSDSRPERGGRSRRYFKVRAAGVRALERTRAAVASMWEGLDLKNV
jgi:DNA-binding PadR family transcriptional regulator